VRLCLLTSPIRQLPYTEVHGIAELGFGVVYLSSTCHKMPQALFIYCNFFVWNPTPEAILEDEPIVRVSLFSRWEKWALFYCILAPYFLVPCPQSLAPHQPLSEKENYEVLRRYLFRLASHESGELSSRSFLVFDNLLSHVQPVRWLAKYAFDQSWRIPNTLETFNQKPMFSTCTWCRLRTKSTILLRRVFIELRLNLLNLVLGRY